MTTAASSPVYSLDVEYALTTCFEVSAVMFVVCVGILISGACVGQHSDKLRSENNVSQLQFISTQMGVCLEQHAWVSYGVVLAMQLQLLLLLFLFLRCLHTWNASIKINVCRVERTNRAAMRTAAHFLHNEHDICCRVPQ
jgi:hypothetical protein